MDLRRRGSLWQKKKKSMLVMYSIDCFTQMISNVEQVEDLSLLSQKMRKAVVYRWDENTNQYG